MAGAGRSYFVICGVALTLGLYTYVAFRLFPFATAIMAIVALLHDWVTGDRKRARRLVFGLSLAFVTVLVLTAPLLNFARTDWLRFSHRFQEVSVFTEVQNKQSAEPIIENVKRHVGMFNYRGGIRLASSLPFDDAWQPGYPMLGIPFAAFFLVGFFRNLRRLHTPLGIGLLATMVTSLTAGALTVTLETPHQTRAFIALVPAAFFAGEGLVATAAALARWLRAVPRTAPAVISIVLVIGALAEGEMYRRQLLHPEAWYDFDGSTNLIARDIRTIPPSTQVVVSPTLKGFPSDNIVRFVTGRDLDTLKSFDPATDLPYHSAERPIAYLVTPVDYPMLASGSPPRTRTSSRDSRRTPSTGSRPCATTSRSTS